MWLVDARRREVGELGNPAADVLAVGVEALALALGVEDAVVRRGVRACPGDPLPAVVVGWDVAVVEVLEEEPGAPGPVEMEVLDEEAGDDHPHPVVHEPLGDELAHAGVDDRNAGAAGAPCGESLICVRATVELDTGESLVERRPRRRRPGMQHVRVEVTPGELLGERLMSVVGEVESAEQLPRVQTAELEVWPEPAGRVCSGQVAVLVVLPNAMTQESIDGVMGGLLTRRRAPDGGRRCPCVGDPIAPHAAHGCDQRRTSQRRGGVEPAPATPVRGEHLVWLARRSAQRAKGHHVGLVDDDRLDLFAKRVVDFGVSTPPGRPSVGGAVQAGDAVAVDEIGERRHRVVVADDEAPVELLIEVGETTGEEPAPIGAGSRPSSDRRRRTAG